MLKYNLKNSNFTFEAIALLAILSIYVWLFLQVGSNYLPVWSDEFFYYTNANSFFQNNTLQAALTFNGSGSRLIGADAHGFAYPLLNGGIAKIFGWHTLNFIYTNLFFVLAALAVVWFQKDIAARQKLLITASVLCFPFFVLFGFTYMQESIHILFAIACSSLIYKIYKTGQSKHCIIFVLVVLVAAAFRPLWFFWLIGLIPFAKNKLQKKSFIFIFLTGVLASFAFTYFFTEAVPNYFSSLINLMQQGDFITAFTSLVKHFVYNVYAYFFSTNDTLIYLPVKYLILLPLIVFVVKAIKHKSSLYTSITLIGFVNFSMLFLFYDVFKWREIRVLAPFFYFSVFYLITETGRYFKYIQVAALAVLFILTLPLTGQWIQGRNIHLAEEVNNSRIEFDLIAQKVESGKLIFINYTPADSSLDLILLPVKNKTNQPVRYIAPYYNSKKAVYDYILNKPGTSSKDSFLISNKYYQLQSIRRP
ncbi:hypothetical protein [Ferruginibacter sp.]|nr:hypothetical protein [Ferruginibacter sp.]